MTAVEASDKLMDKLPKPIRRLFELIGMGSAIVTLVGWLASTFSLVAKMTFWSAAWAAILSWSIQFPDWFEQALRALGVGAHWLLERFRDFAYPIFEWLFQWLPFEVPPIAIDVISIVLFGVFGAARLMAIYDRHGNDEGSVVQNPLWWATKGGILFPLILVQAVPFILMMHLLNVVEGLGDAFSDLNNWFTERLGEYWGNTVFFATFGLPFLCAFPLTIFLVEWLYVTFGS